jgi:hypothetical protein
MSNAVPSPVVMTAGNAPAFVLADLDLAEMLAALAPFTTPARFQMLLFGMAGQPEGLDWLKHKHGRLRGLFLVGWIN